MVERDILDAPDLGTFVEYEDAAFTVERGDGSEVELRLREVDTSRNSRRDDLRRFSLLFDTVGDEHLEGDLYRVRHPRLEPFDVNIEPKATDSPDPDDVVYESVFNRHAPEEDSGGLFGDGLSRRGVLGGLLGLVAGALLGGDGGTARAAPEPARASASAGALMAGTPLVGGISIFAGTFAPKGWAFCNGQILPISENNALFSLIGSVYGGDGRTTFGLPDLRGRVPVHSGDPPGRGAYSLGQTGGAERVTLSTDEMPSHDHDVSVETGDATTTNPAGNVPAASPTGRVPGYADTGGDATLDANAVVDAGGNQPHENRMPYQVVNYCIALEGTYPSRQ